MVIDTYSLDRNKGFKAIGQEVHSIKTMAKGKDQIIWQVC